MGRDYCIEQYRIISIAETDNGDMNEHLKRIKNDVSRGNYSITQRSRMGIILSRFYTCWMNKYLFLQKKENEMYYFSLGVAWICSLIPSHSV